jgi:uncharacterized lipoprotein YehR (DUF1307 family)
VYKRLIPLIAILLVISLTGCNDKEVEEPTSNSDGDEPVAIEEETNDPVIIDFEVVDRLVLNESIDGINVDVRQPIVTDKVVNYDKINTALSTMDYHDDRDDIRDFLLEYNGNNPNSPITSYTVDYDVVTDNLNISVISIFNEINFTASGDLEYYDCYYYDHDTNEVISSEECLRKHGYTWDEAVDIAMAEDETFREFYDRDDPFMSAISNLYFVFDGSGRLNYYYQLWL